MMAAKFPCFTAILFFLTSSNSPVSASLSPFVRDVSSCTVSSDVASAMKRRRSKRTGTKFPVPLTHSALFVSTHTVKCVGASYRRERSDAVIPSISTATRNDALANQLSSPSPTSLFGTVRFAGVATAKVNGDVAMNNDNTDDSVPSRSISDFLSSSASDAVLLGMKNDGGTSGISECKRIQNDGYGGNNSEVWECRQSSLDWFGLTLVPIFINSIERSSVPVGNAKGEGAVVIDILDAKTEVQNGGRLGNTLASAMKRSIFEGRVVIRWQDHASGTTNLNEKYTLDGDIKLNLTIKLPPFLPLPPGFNAIGSKIVERTCKDRLQKNLEDVSTAYLLWATKVD